MLKKNDLLVLNMNNEITPSDYTTLALLYKPLMHSHAYEFYVTLVAIKQYGLPIKNHTLIQRTLNISMEAIQHARTICEQYQLIRSYYNETTKTYLYELGLPLKPHLFLSHEVFGRLFQKKLGSDTLSFYRQSVQKHSKKNYVEVSQNMTNLLKNEWEEQDENEFKRNQKHLIENNYDYLHVIFDEKKFLADLGEVVLPHEQRTPKLLRSIAEIATIYGINESMMRKQLVKAWDYDLSCLDLEMLRQQCAKTTAKYTSNVENPYLLPTRRFLEYKQNGVRLSFADLKLVNKLMEEYHLQPEVANVLLDTCMKMNQERIIGTSVERMAASWTRLQIDHLEGALQQMGIELNTKVKKGQSKQKTIVQTWETQEQEVVDMDETLQLMDQLKQLKGEMDETS